MDAVLQNAQTPTTGEALIEGGLEYVCDLVSFAELKGLRGVCRSFNDAVRRHPRFLTCIGRLEHDWVEEARGINFEQSPKFIGYYFRFFPFQRNALFGQYWESRAPIVTKLTFKNAKIPCNEMVEILQGCPLLTEINFNLCNFKLEEYGQTRDIRNASFRTCCLHAGGLADLQPQPIQIPPRIHTIRFQAQNFMPLCVMDLIFSRAEGVIHTFSHKDACFVRIKRQLFSPSKDIMERRMENFLARNSKTIQSFTWYKIHGGDVFLKTLFTKRVLMNPRELIIGQKSSWDRMNTYLDFFNFISLCGPALETLHLRMIHRYDATAMRNAIQAKPNLKRVTIDTVWTTQNTPLALDLILPRWPLLESLEIWDRNRRREPSIVHDYLNLLPQTLKKLKIFHFYQLMPHVEQFIRGPVAYNLTELSFESGKEFTNAMMQLIIVTLPNLEVLAVANSKHLNDAGLTGLNEKSVKTIVDCKSSIFYKYPVDPALLTGRSICELKKLRKLSFCMSRNVSDISIYLAFKFPELREINLSWCLNVTDIGIYWLAKNNPALERVVLMKNRKITHYGLNELIKESPTLKNIHTSRSCRDRKLGKQLNYVEHPRFKRIVSYAKWRDKRPTDYGQD